MQRLIDAVLFQLGVDGLREAGFGEANGLGAFHGEEFFKVRTREMLHHRVVGEIFQHFLAARFGDVIGDEDKVELAFVGAESVAANEQGTGFNDEREEAFDRVGSGVAHLRGFIKPAVMWNCERIFLSERSPSL